MNSRFDCRHRVTVERADGLTGNLLARAAALAAAGCRPLVYCEQPATGAAMLAAGSAHTIATAGAQRLGLAEAAARAVSARLTTAAAAPDAPAPRFVGGFGFARAASPDQLWHAFPSCGFFLPERLWVQAGAATWSLHATPCAQAGPLVPDTAAQRPRTVASDDAAALSERDHWMARVERALSLISTGALSKLVLARRRVWSFADGLDVPRMLAALRTSRPGCVTFWCASDDSHFIGSTPELLLRCDGLHVESFALAGTAPRRRDGHDDAVRGAALLESAKDRREHDAVVRSICAALDPLAASLQTCAQPHLLTVPEAHHLRTVITATLRAPHHVLELADRLHPTPAVCGLPRDAAWPLLEREEPNRGWYAGGIGWFDVQGAGAFAVALRSALVRGRDLTLWAGAGIVAGSEPAAEFAETEAKMRPMLDASRTFAPLGHDAPPVSARPHP
jgi:isochorismate synthase